MSMSPKEASFFLRSLVRVVCHTFNVDASRLAILLEARIFLIFTGIEDTVEANLL